MKRYFLLLPLCACLQLVFYSCGKKTQRLPLVTTSVHSPGIADATVSGVLYAPGDADVTEQGVCYGTAANTSIYENRVVCPLGTQNFTARLAGLAPQTRYFARAYAKNKFGTAYGKEITFVTLSADLPSMNLYVPFVVSPDKAQLSLSIYQSIQATFTLGICWSKNPIPSVNDYTLYVDDRTASDIPFYGKSYSPILANLEAGVTYYARAFCKSPYALSYGNIVNWTMPTPVNPVSFSVQSVGFTDASCFVYLKSISWSEVLYTGICWSETSFPTNESPNYKNEVLGYYQGVFSLANLSANKTYYLRAYVVTPSGVIYSEAQKIIRTLKSTFIDIDGNIYNTVEINGLEWMTSNLRVSKLNNGISLQLITDYNQWVNSVNAQLPVYCYYGDNQGYNLPYGKLYPRHIAENANIAPMGWRVATVSDWQNLLSAVGVQDLCVDNTSWNTSQSFQNSFNFSLYPAGWWSNGYSNFGYGTRFWATPSSGGSYNTIEFPSFTTSSIVWMPNGNGQSIRCVKE